MLREAQRVEEGNAEAGVELMGGNHADDRDRRASEVRPNRCRTDTV